MPWGLAGNIKGPAGPQGPAGLPNITSITNYSPINRALSVVYRPSITRPTIVIPVISLHTQLSLIGTSSARVDIFADTNNPPTTQVARFSISKTIGVGVTVSDVTDVSGQMVVWLQPGWYYRMVPTTANGGTAAVTSTTEIVT